jgi:hypothetical protein
MSTPRGQLIAAKLKRLSAQEIFEFLDAHVGQIKSGFAIDFFFPMFQEHRAEIELFTFEPIDLLNHVR